jgi:hypothetical protein
MVLLPFAIGPDPKGKCHRDPSKGPVSGRHYGCMKWDAETLGYSMSRN